MEIPVSLANIVVNDDTARFIQEECGDHRVYFDGATDQLKYMISGSLRLKAGMSPHPPHQHPEEEFMVVTEGTGKIEVDGKTTEVGPGSMMYCAGGKYHGIWNTGRTPMLFYYYKWLA
jgi:mannose-6-phosphate isomerase-like protein (cupin superfamily)